MAENGNGNGHLKAHSGVSERTLRNFIEDLRIANSAVHKAQEENRRLGIPNWYSINGQIVSDIELAERNNGKKWRLEPLI
ncbi:hypothetical protein BH10ACI2_BH10ACI2_25670 [soil metagenome]